MTRVEDVLEVYGLEPSRPPAAALGGVAEVLLGQLSAEPRTADELVRVSGVEPGAGAAALVELELAGRITLEDGVYRAAL